MKKHFIFFFIFFLLGTVIFSQRVFFKDLLVKQTKQDLPASISFQEVVEQEEVIPVQEEVLPVQEEQPEPEEIILEEQEIQPIKEPVKEFPEELNLAVPFTSQAPHANWELPYKEACEEASLLMVHEFYQGLPAGKIDPEEADKEIKLLVDFQMEIFGFFEDTTVQQTALLAQLSYGYGKMDIVENPTKEQIKSFLVLGYPVIVPAAGQLLGNPYFQQPGPLYHMVVIKGYTQEGFITNDPGTRRGEDYIYDFDVLLQAMHDFNEEDIEQGNKVVLVIYPE